MFGLIGVLEDGLQRAPDLLRIDLAHTCGNE
jgi:hypothetical protein